MSYAYIRIWKRSGIFSFGVRLFYPTTQTLLFRLHFLDENFSQQSSICVTVFCSYLKRHPTFIHTGLQIYNAML